MHIIPEFEILSEEPKEIGAFQLSPVDEETDDLILEAEEMYFEMEFGKAKQILEKIIKQNPSYIDSYFILADIARQENRIGEDEAILNRGIEYYKSGIPSDFDGEIPWGFNDNRPFLRLLHELVLTLDRNDNHEKAINNAELILKYNPNDNQGIRYLIGDLYIKNGQLEEAEDYLKKSADQYPPNRYSYALVLAKQNKRWDAITQFRLGFLENIYVSEMLRLKSPMIPYDVFESSNFNGIDVAGDYYMMMGNYWFNEVEPLQLLDYIFTHPTVATEINEVFGLLNELNNLPVSEDFIGAFDNFDSDVTVEQINRETREEILKEIDKIKGKIHTSSSKKILRDFDNYFSDN
ncbi:MAG: tetratricopeptide repeat protein [Balneolaceae bacterium]|nr:tetratricopeptide repeat protein [Balneolaceae bacterium]